MIKNGGRELGPAFKNKDLSFNDLSKKNFEV